MKHLFYLLLLSVTIMSCNETTKPKDPIDNARIVVNNPNVTTASYVQPEMSVRRYDPQILPHLKNLSRLLSTGTVSFYDWNDNTSCNMGLMSQVCLNKTAKEMKDEWNKMVEYNDYAKERHKEDNKFQEGAWSNAVNYYCGITGKPSKYIIGDLLNKGFTSLDISGLEYLSDNYILSKTDIKPEGTYYADATNLLKYLNAWILIIEKQNQQEYLKEHQQ